MIFASENDMPVMDLGVIPPPQPKFLHFHPVFGENWSNNRLVAPQGLAPPLPPPPREILDLSLHALLNISPLKSVLSVF